MERGTPDRECLIETRGITKAFGGSDVVHDVSFKLFRGEILGLMGENGAGKSTIMKVLAGVHVPDSGSLLVEGTETRVLHPQQAIENGIALINQEPLSFPDLSIGENIFVGRHPRTRFIPFVSWKGIEGRARDVLDSLGIRMDVRKRARDLSLADQQMVDIAAALSENVKILLMDEPTASLTPNEVGRLFVIMRRLREQGAGIIFVNHRIEEVFEVSDRIIVLRDGKLVAESRTEDTDANEVIRHMVGREVEAVFPRARDVSIGDPLLQVSGLSLPGIFEDISFEVRSGEIVGMAGLVGAGRSEVAHALFGIRSAQHGEIRIDGKRVHISRPSDAIRAGIAYVPEDRQHQGLFFPMSVTENATLAFLSALSKRGWLQKSSESEIATDFADKLRVVRRSMQQPVMELSGGNQQKVVLSRWLMGKPRVMILDEPTRGVDVGAKAEVHRLVQALAGQGIGILLISSDLPEILAMSDRVLVMNRGNLTANFEKGEFDSERIMRAAIGKKVIGAFGE
jgi:rhamnose transport system ATP-binding protein